MKAFLIPALIFLIMIVIVLAENGCTEEEAHDQPLQKGTAGAEAVAPAWTGWNHYQIPDYTAEGKQVRYGYELIANTAHYLGPKGTVAALSNGMNCQNCHLKGGTVPFGNNFGKVFATYPQYRARNNGIQDIYARINDCFQRSLNGQKLDTASKEMQAIYAYLRWLGDGVPRGKALPGTSIMKLKFLDRAADPTKGRSVYQARCITCHGEDGAGQPDAEGTGHLYPPLWGAGSFNDGAGLFRLRSMAGFIKNNMPLGTTYRNPQLTDEECWDVAAYIDSQPRPAFDQHEDWALLAKKPLDAPYGPYIDSFSERQHKYGPYGPIELAQAALK
ncbi:c-type cytochrome [Niabella drilacis]|uniref:Cytochrome c n=1 Tax=Niabella drilacis (strain DSM 25811 / CCM 8410 / CCUG 62505 / LMG 26954 / E90) TaxID=1285928 RepID=A0A1G6IGJ4_NIADE|nr:c-type cytochrome [Niabella drilacis]SDC05520.1 Cytochrome c [Niabella drilacis]